MLVDWHGSKLGHHEAGMCRSHAVDYLLAGCCVMALRKQSPAEDSLLALAP